MSKVLIVEDDPHKRQQLERFFSTRAPAAGVKVAVSLIGGLRALRAHNPDVVVLDMTLPNHDPEEDGHIGSMLAFGGEEFLRQARRLRSSAKVIVVTQFETFGDEDNAKGRYELEAHLAESFPEIFMGMVYYHASLSGWADELDALFHRALQGDGS
jgi:DNA-binding NarL/FixJ family response regulator